MVPILARTFFRVQERLLGRRTFAILRQLEASQWWGRDRVRRLQLARLQDLVSTAYEHSPYWHSLMDSRGIRPGDIRSLEDLRRFPLLEKSSLRARREEMVWRGAGRRVKLIRTSGSTNEALQFYTNSHREANINAARIRGHRWIGVNIGDKEVYFWASPVELSSQDRIKRIRDGLTNNLLTNAVEMTEAAAPGYVAQWKRWRPACLFGYPSSFVLLANMARKAGIDLRELRDSGVKAISTSSEMLLEEDRRIITEAFGLPVYDSYGLREGGFVGHECEHFTMHCCDEQLILETIDPETHSPTDGEGELVLTNLTSHVMPIIRYRTGDIVTLSSDPCPCGRPLSRIRVSGGRLIEFVVTTGGKWVPGYAFIYVCRSVPGIVKFQVLQDRPGQVRVLLATDGNFPSDGPEQVKAKVRARLASEDEIEVELVDDIQPAGSGKYRPVISKVAEQLRQAGDFAPKDGTF